MPDQTITLLVPSDKVDIALEGFLTVYPNTERVGDITSPLVYTDREWVTERIRRFVVSSVRRGLQMKADRAAIVDEDDTVCETP